MISRIHVNQHNLRANRSNKNTALPVITVKTYKDNTKGNTASICDLDGRIVCRVVYRPNKPLSCGAVLWVETELDVVVD